MTARDHNTCFTRHHRTAEEDQATDAVIQIRRQRRDIQPEEGGSAHGINIRHAVGSRDAPVIIGVINHRCEKIDGENQGAILVELPDRRIVR